MGAILATRTPPTAATPSDDSFWTVFTATEPSGEGSAFVGAGTRKIYVASAAHGGSNANTGTQASPKLTAAAGIALLRDGKPDWLLFNKGDVWTESFGRITLQGLSAAAPMLFGAYGTGARPQFKCDTTEIGMGFFGGGTDGNNVAVVGIELYSYQRNPDDPGWDETAAIAADVSGLFLLDQVDYFLMEDCKISFFVDNLNVQACNLALFRRNIIVDSWSVEPRHAQGGYFDAILDLQLIENYFDHNGWLEGEVYQVRDIFNHNWYIQDNQRGPVTLIGNYSARDNAGGQCRAGGLINGNMCIQGMEMTNVFMNIFCTVTNNVMTELTNSLGLGAALRISGTYNNPSVSAGGTYTGNIATHGGDNPMTATFILQDSPADAIVTSNIFFDWKCTSPGWFGSAGSGTTLTGNDIDLNGTNNNPGGLAPNEPFPHPERTVASYAASIGVSPATTAGYLAACRLQSKDNWNTALEAEAIINYFRAGFNLAPISLP